MKFKVEISVDEITFYEIVYAENYWEVEKQVKEKYPKGKIISSIGGPCS